MKRIAIKIGSNVLARRDGTLDITRMSALVDQVVSLRRAGMEVVIISITIMSFSATTAWRAVRF